jgi:two-component system sensor histidine kinase MtrB
MRLLIAFIALTAITSGVLALSSYAIIHHHRTSAFGDRAQREVSLLVLSSAKPTVDQFNEAIDRYRRHADFDAVVIDADGELSSVPSISTADFPESLRSSDSSPEIRNDTVTIDGESYLIVADHSVNDRITYYFLYSRTELLQGLAEFRNVLLLGWLVSIAAAAGVGLFVARQTLRPVAEAADAAESVAHGNLHARLRTTSRDEFGRLAASFNAMTEALDGKMKELSDAAERERGFTAAVAHDLRTPITVMLSAADLLRDDLDRLQPDQMRRPLELLIQDVHRLHRLVEELLELARIDAGNVELEHEPYSVRRAVDSVLATWRRDLPSSGTIIDVDESLLAFGDPACTQRIIENLVDNAARHANGVTSVRAHRSAEHILIEVCDDGPGVPEAILDHVFDRFFKGDSSRSRSGSGLGLALARHYAQIQRGTLVVANRAEGGACFTLTLPAAAVAAIDDELRPVAEIRGSESVAH